MTLHRPSPFGARRVCGKKGRGTGGKTIVFGILERQRKVYTEIVPAAAKKQLQAAIRGQVALFVFNVLRRDTLKISKYLSEAKIPRPVRSEDRLHGQHALTPVGAAPTAATGRLDPQAVSRSHLPGDLSRQLAAVEQIPARSSRSTAGSTPGGIAAALRN